MFMHKLTVRGRPSASIAAPFHAISECAADNVALVSGPHLAQGTVTVSLELIDEGGFALIARARGPLDRIEAVVVPQVEARIRLTVFVGVQP